MFKEYNDNHRTIGGVPEGFDAHVLLQAVVKFNGPILFIARDDSRLAAMQTALRFFEPSLPVFVFPIFFSFLENSFLYLVGFVDELN